MAIIRAPFNFVPLSEKVFFPNWADQISQDIPFADGLSGTIDLTITAESPIFIRNGHTKKDADEKNEEYLSFSHINGSDGHPKYFIPGTSIKGEVRNLIEIMSFSKMDVDKRAMFARRDLTPHADYPLKGVQKTIHCGWLRCANKNGKEVYIIEDCGQPMRISQPDIDKYFNSNILEDHFSRNSKFDLNNKTKLCGKDYDPKTALFKNKLVEGEKPLNNLTFKVVGHNQIGAKKVAVDANGTEKGTIVLTGQPDQWKDESVLGRGKYYEFVFPEVDTPATHTISKEMFDHFIFIYKDSAEWTYTKEALYKKVGRGVPVFFRLENGKVKDFGLTYLYKMPYNQSVYDSLYDNHKKQRVDMAECIFGYTNDKDSLKGRVQFGNAFAIQAEKASSSVKLVLSSPKASYVPIYVEQEGGDKYTTYDTGHPKGWKRYYVRENIWEPDKIEVNKNGVDSQSTTIYPLNSHAEFESTISFHNLRPVELGALLAALTFFNTPNCYHQLGQAKPYGYGVCRYNIKKFRVYSINNNENTTGAGQKEKLYMKAFESYMNENLGSGNKWVQQPQIVQLFTIASQRVCDIYKFKYMELIEYAEAKSSQESLLPATALELEETKPESILRPSKPDCSHGLFSLIPENPNFGDWLSGMKSFDAQGHDTLTDEESNFAFEQLKIAKKISESHNAPMNKWKLGGENFKRCKKIKIVGTELASKWFSDLQ